MRMFFWPYLRQPGERAWLATDGDGDADDAGDGDVANAAAARISDAVLSGVVAGEPLLAFAWR